MVNSFLNSKSVLNRNRKFSLTFLFILIVLLTQQTYSTIQIPFCDSKNILSLSLSYINGTKDNTTKVLLCHDEQFFYIQWDSQDDQIISTYTKCNDPLYNEDVVQIFVSTSDSYPINYFQLEVSPKGQLFFADITNKNGNCSSLGTKYIDCNQAQYSAQKTTQGWKANLKVSLQILGRGSKKNIYLANIFRIDKSTTKPTKYLAWSPPYTSPACFHKPSVFQTFQLAPKSIISQKKISNKDKTHDASKFIPRYIKSRKQIQEYDSLQTNQQQ